MDPHGHTPPAYEGGSLAEVLPGLLAALGVPGVADPLGLTSALAGARRVALLLVDGLGHLQLPMAARVAPVLTAAASGRYGWAGVATAAFPSSTPISLVTLGTGRPPGEHGVVGFTVRVPGTDRVLNHIHWDDDPDPLVWQPLPTRFAQAAAAGVRVSVVSMPEFADSGLTRSAFRGADYVGADTGTLAATMLSALTAEPAPTLVYGYHPDVDRAGHVFGVGSRRWRRAVRRLDRVLDRLVSGLPADAALVITADHGQLNVPADRRVDLDADPRLRDGVVAVAGDPRVRYLYTAAGATGDVLATWREVLGEAAWVGSREQAVAEGWFGTVPPSHLERLGDVVVVCRERYAVFATAHEPETVSRLVAYHGSLTAAEMLVPLLVVRPDR
ncbi:MAG TPA: alkaline phosphatase family protein [Natronosporangium sp.]|nr:alkaline phosphatase family protein [Natronosporangium sp.]